MIRAAISVILGIVLAAGVPITAVYVATGQHPSNPMARPFGEGHAVRR